MTLIRLSLSKMMIHVMKIENFYYFMSDITHTILYKVLKSEKGKKMLLKTLKNTFLKYILKFDVEISKVYLTN